MSAENITSFNKLYNEYYDRFVRFANVYVREAAKAVIAAYGASQQAIHRQPTAICLLHWTFLRTKRCYGGKNTMQAITSAIR